LNFLTGTPAVLSAPAASFVFPSRTVWSLGKTRCPEELQGRQELRGSRRTSLQGERVGCISKLPVAAVQVQRKESMACIGAGNPRWHALVISHQETRTPELCSPGPFRFSGSGGVKPPLQLVDKKRPGICSVAFCCAGFSERNSHFLTG
jgi:hypothetical protein